MNKPTFRPLGAAAAVLAALAFSGTAARATSVEPCNLAEACHKAQKIFYGECVGARRTVVAIRSVEVPAMEYDFRAMDGVRGVASGDIVTFRHYGAPTYDPETRERSAVPPAISGMPEYARGRRYLLCLNPENEFGLTSPAGLQQGAFAEVPDAQGRAGLVNGVGNATLFHGMEARERSSALTASAAGGRERLEFERVELDARERSAIAHPTREPLQRDLLLGLARKLAASPVRVAEVPPAAQVPGEEASQPSTAPAPQP